VSGAPADFLKAVGEAVGDSDSGSDGDGSDGDGEATATATLRAAAAAMPRRTLWTKTLMAINYGLLRVTLCLW
jgi:hypothetical protein